MKKLSRTSLLLLAIFLTTEATVTSEESVKTIGDLTLGRQDINKLREIHKNWYFFSVKALLAQMAKEFLATTTERNAKKLKVCLKGIKQTKDVVRTARCLTEARRSKDHQRFITRKSRQKSRFDGVKRLKFQWPWGDVQRKQENADVPKRKRRSLQRLVISNVFKSDSDFVLVNQSRSAPPLLEPSTASLAHRLSTLFISLFSSTKPSDLSSTWSSTYKKMLELKTRLEQDENSPGRRVYDETIHDLVVQKGTTWQDKGDMYIPPYLKDIVGVVKSFSGAGNVRVLSPRLLPLVPDRLSTSQRFLSPTLLPFYRDDSEQQILPIPKLLEASGLNEKDRERVLEMVMEVSGARSTVDNAMKILRHLNSFGMGKAILSVSKKIDETFERLHSSLKNYQKDDLGRRGYTFMDEKQMSRLLDDQGLNAEEMKEQVREYGRMSREEREEALWEAVAKISGRKKRRHRRFTLINVLKPLTLSPYQFAPVTGLGVLGPVVLSPNIFAPLILNPAILSPWVLSPSVPLPFIVSPYVLSPYVLSPLAMAPFILTPYVLSPNVINPYVLSPLILSPLVLCPDVISPMTLGGAILSPSVLSPSVLSKSYVMASVLSPSLLS